MNDFENKYKEVTQTLCDNHIVKYSSQCSIIRHDYKGNLNQYFKFFEDFDEFKITEAEFLRKREDAVIKRFEGKLYRFYKDEFGNTIEGDTSPAIVSFLADYSKQGNNRYEFIRNRLREAVFDEPLTTTILNKMIASEVSNNNDIFAIIGYEDFSNKPYYNRDIYAHEIKRGGTHTDWTLGCLKEIAYFNIQKYNNYFNLILSHDNDYLYILGLFLDDKAYEELFNLLKQNTGIKSKFISVKNLPADIKSHIILNGHVSYLKLSLCKKLFGELKKLHEYSWYENDINKMLDFLDQLLINPELYKTHKQALRSLFAEENVTKDTFIVNFINWTKRNGRLSQQSQLKLNSYLP